MVLRRGGRKIHDIFLKINQSAKVRTFNRVETLNLFVMGTKAYSNSDVVLTAPAQKHLSPEENTIRKRLKQGKGTWCCGIFFFLTYRPISSSSLPRSSRMPCPPCEYRASIRRCRTVSYRAALHKLGATVQFIPGGKQNMHTGNGVQHIEQSQIPARGRDGEQWSEWGGDFVSTV